MTPKTKAESPLDFVAKIDDLERQSDSCYRGLEILRREWNFATWLSLTEILRQLHLAISPTQYGTGKHKVAVTNFGRVGEQMRRFCQQHAKAAPCSPSRFRWSRRAAAESAVAFEVARNYSMFCIDFPAWHANLYTAELVNHATIRFRSGDSDFARRVNAYGKGIRPLASPTAPGGGVLPAISQQLQTLFAEAMQFSRTRGVLGVDFRNTDDLRAALRDMYSVRLSGLFRRYPNISLGAIRSNSSVTVMSLC
jgi:hypothetical protein